MRLLQPILTQPGDLQLLSLNNPYIILKQKRDGSKNLKTKKTSQKLFQIKRMP